MMTEELPASALGTKKYWDDFYQNELTNYNDHEESGEIWFGMESVRRMVRWITREITDKTTSVLDLGCGNGMVLLELADEGYDKLTGVDYSKSAIDLAVSLAKDKPIKYETGDLLDLKSSLILSLQYSLVLDKGTYDAVSLSPTNATQNRLTYIQNVRVGGGNITDLKRLSRHNSAAVAAATKKELANGEWTDHEKKNLQSVKLKADVDLDNESTQEPDVVTSHQRENGVISDPSESVKTTEDENMIPTGQQTLSEDDCESIEDMGQGENPEINNGNSSTSVTKKAPVEEEMVQTRIVKEIQMTPSAPIEIEDGGSGKMKEEETQIVLSTPSRAVATAGLTLSLERGKPKPIVDEVDSGSSPSKMRGGKSGRSLFQLRRSGPSDTSPATSPITMPVDKVLLVKSKDSGSPAADRNSTSSSSSFSEFEKKE